ncbi:hypothetical protein JCM8547_006005 [Rhodosporidiobolus lusitaniae]
MLVPLTFIDKAADGVGLSCCFVFQLPTATNEGERDELVDSIRQAAIRVVKKWPLLGGKPEWTRGGLAIRISESSDKQPNSRLGFSTITYDKPFHEAAGLSLPLPPLTSTPSAVYPVSDISFFRPSSVPRRLLGHWLFDKPLLHVHVSLFRDAVAVGVSVPHGVLDGTGVGILVRALDAELRGRTWDAPPLPNDDGNPLPAALDNLEADHTVSQQASKLSNRRLLQCWAPMSFLGMLALLTSMIWEQILGQSQARRAFLTDETLGRLASEVKGQVKDDTDGREFVSTGDVLVAWFLKTVHADEVNTRDQVHASAAYSARWLLDSHSPSPLSLYPSNLLFLYDLFPRPIPLSFLPTAPLATLARSSRGQLTLSRSLPVVSAVSRWMRNSRRLIPVRDSPFRLTNRPRAYRWFFSNHTALGLADLSLPHPSAAAADANNEQVVLPLSYFFFAGVGPVDPDHVITFQKVPGGVNVSGNMRKSRWEALARSIEALEAEGAA